MNDAGNTTGQAIMNVEGLQVAAGQLDVLRNAGLADLDALFAPGLGESLGKPGLASWRSRIRVTAGIGPVQKVLYVKRFDRPPRRARREVRAAGCGARSVAGVEWHWLFRLSALGIPCATPVALGEEFRRGRELRSVVVMREVPGRSLESLCPAWGKEDRPLPRDLLPAVADMVRRLHAAGLYHRDLYLSHLFYEPEGDPPLALIDLQRMIDRGPDAIRWIVKDLAALSYSTPESLVSTRERLRWLKHYLGLPMLNQDAKFLAYRIMGRAAAMARHDARRRRGTHESRA